MEPPRTGEGGGEGLSWRDCESVIMNSGSKGAEKNPLPPPLKQRPWGEGCKCVLFAFLFASRALPCPPSPGGTDGPRDGGAVVRPEAGPMLTRPHGPLPASLSRCRGPLGMGWGWVRVGAWGRGVGLPDHHRSTPHDSDGDSVSSDSDQDALNVSNIYPHDSVSQRFKRSDFRKFRHNYLTQHAGPVPEAFRCCAEEGSGAWDVGGGCGHGGRPCVWRWSCGVLGGMGMFGLLKGGGCLTARESVTHVSSSLDRSYLALLSVCCITYL